MSYCSLLKTFASVIIMNITVNLGVINKSSYTPRQGVMSSTSQLPSLSLHQSGFTCISLSRTAPLKLLNRFSRNWT